MKENELNRSADISSDYCFPSKPNLCKVMENRYAIL